MTFNLNAHIRRQREWSEVTFGPGDRVYGITDHIKKEIIEVCLSHERGEPTLPEWVDLIILSLDGAWRSGATPEDIAAALQAKQSKNEKRAWPNWRTAKPDTAIEHDRTKD